MTHQGKVEYLHTVLPMLMALRRRTGLPHKILLDEAHYFLSGPDSIRLIDPELQGYIFVTYRVSRLDPAIRTSGDVVVIVTRETDPEEALTLLDLCRLQPGTTISSRAFDLTMKQRYCRAPVRGAALAGPAATSGTIR
jgi:hypothetical protein